MQERFFKGLIKAEKMLEALEAVPPGCLRTQRRNCPAKTFGEQRIG
jgi:hypothetical protein